MIYIALLRGINVGGKNKIKMAELRKTIERLGLSQVQTYIQSGNVLFRSDDGAESLRKRIEGEIKKDFGLSVNVILRTAEELEAAIDHCPFSEDAIAEAEASSEGESLYVSFLQDVPSKEGIERLKNVKSESEAYRIKGREIYLLFHHSVRNSKLANQLQKLDVPATMRNWKTTNKLALLAKEMGD